MTTTNLKKEWGTSGAANAVLPTAGIKKSPEHNLLIKFRSKPTRKYAINAFCFHCLGGTLDEMPDPGWKDIIRTCTDTNCPLYLFRPYKSKLRKGN